MKITKEWLKEQRACEEGYRWFVGQKETNTAKVLRKLLKENHFDWANWTIVRAMDLKKKRQYAVYAAEQVLSIYEKMYPKDDRPRKAIEAAKKCIENDTEDNRNAANAAATAANAANAAAYAAATAANAANAAVYAANAATATAANAVYAATAANAAANAANAAMKKKIIEYGIGLLGEVKRKESNIAFMGRKKGRKK